MAVGDLSTSVISTALITPSIGTSFVNPAQPMVTRGDGASVFVAVFDNETTLGDGRLGLATFAISTGGVITNTILDELSISTETAARYDLINVADGMVALAFSDPASSNSPFINTYSVNSTGGLALVQSVNLEGDTAKAQGSMYISHITGEVYFVSYELSSSGNTRGRGVTINITSTGGITAPLDGPKNISPGGLQGAGHPATWVRSAYMVMTSTSARISVHTMTAGGVFSTNLVTSSYGVGGVVGLPRPLTLDSGQGIVAISHGNSAQTLRTFVVSSTGGISTSISSTQINTVGVVTGSRMMYLGSRTLLVWEDDVPQVRTFVSDISGALTTVATLSSTNFANSGRGAAYFHVSGNVVGISRWISGTTASFYVSTINAENELTPNSGLAINILVDWNNDGVFSSTEDISTDCTRLSWRRGREAEQGETPIGTALIELKDPNADYNPLNTGSKWGSTLVRINKEVLARAVFGTSTYGLFRGRIGRISPLATPDAIRATLFVVDGMEELTRKFVSFPNSAATTAGGSPTSGERPTLKVVGSTFGAIAAVLDEASWSSTRRKLNQTGSSEGSSFTNYWTYGKSARAAITQLEALEFRGKIFVDRDGDITFHAAGHYDASTFLYHFNVAFQAWDHAYSDRNLINAGAATIHGRDQSSAVILGSVNVATIPTITVGTTLVLTIPLSPAPTADFFIPNILTNSSEGSAAVGVSGTSYTNTQVTVRGEALGASALRLRIANNTTESVNIARASLMTTNGYDDTNTVLHVAGNTLNDHSWTSTASIADSIAAFGRRAAEVDLIFQDKVPQAVDRSVNLATFYSTGKADFTRLAVAGTDTTIVEQLLARAISDRIRVTSTGLKISTGRDYYINAAEYELAPGNAAGLGYNLSAVYSLEEAT